MANKSGKAGRKGSDMTKFYWVLGAVAVIGVGAVSYSVTSGSGTAATEPVVVEGLDDMNTLVQKAQGITRGDPEAPITIVEFADYQCPACGSFYAQVEPRMNLTFIESGKAKFVYYDFPLTRIHPNAFIAARAARCAGDQDRYWEYHGALYRNQPTWSDESSPIASFVSYADELGLDTGDFEACLKSDRHAEVVTANMRLGEELGVDGTPTLMVSRGQGMAVRLASFDFQSIANAIDELMGEGDGSN